MAARGEFSSRLGFIMAAAGSAVGLGNIWGFPTQTASNGGAAFVFVYLILAFCLAYPAFMAEILIGRYGQANAVSSLEKMANNLKQRKFAYLIGIISLVCAALILSFYSIVAGWMIAHTVEPVANLLSQTATANWLTEFSFSRNIVFTVIFFVLTIWIISQGVEKGIEKWSKRLMPMLLFILIGLIAYVMTLEGAQAGLIAYLKPDFSRVFDADLLLSALGQAFFSLSLGASTMIIYGSYIAKNENMVSLGIQVTLVDIAIAFLAGLLIIPAMYVAQAQGVEIFSASGTLLTEDTLVFSVLPNLFISMGNAGLFVALAFFALMSIAALTSSISMLEGPVAYVVERHGMTRKKASILLGGVIFIISLTIIFNFAELFGLVITMTTQYSQPIVAMLCCLFVGWIWHRNALITELRQGFSEVESSLFFKIWPFYIKFICPLAIGAVFLRKVL